MPENQINEETPAPTTGTGVIGRSMPSDVAAEVYEAERFDADSRMQRLDKMEKDFARSLFNRVGRDASVLDVPCGSGRFLDIFQNVSRLEMRDVSEHMVGVAAEKAASLDHVNVKVGDITALDLPDAWADLTFTMRLFHHMPHDELRGRVFVELARVSRRYVAVTFYNKSSWNYWRRGLRLKKQRGNYITYGRLLRLAAAAGLQPVGDPQRLNIREQQTMVLFEKADA